jgi:hypothetical protein
MKARGDGTVEIGLRGRALSWASLHEAYDGGLYGNKRDGVLRSIRKAEAHDETKSKGVRQDAGACVTSTARPSQIATTDKVQIYANPCAHTPYSVCGYLQYRRIDKVPSTDTESTQFASGTS